MDLKGRGVLVTGAAKRIGKAIALAFARKGCGIFLHHRSSEDEARRAADEVRALGAPCSLVKADLTRPAEIDAMFAACPELSRATVLVNSASVFHKIPQDRVTPELWRENFAVHAEAPFRLARKLAENLRASGAQGAVVNITDCHARRPYAGLTPYFASKAALEALTRTFALEFAPYLRANSVAPGPILFPEGYTYTEEEKNSVLKRVLLKRMGLPEEIAAACVFLAEADYVNGCTVAVDGGASL